MTVLHFDQSRDSMASYDRLITFLLWGWVGIKIPSTGALIQKRPRVKINRHFVFKTRLMTKKVGFIANCGR